ncbi:MAG: hypothetical protein K2W95_13180 [Candidatus Obscuribacterales bacterium]|nr:hypothetical protein [Candidatus Obscuribacterales bacterium]
MRKLLRASLGIFVVGSFASALASSAQEPQADVLEAQPEPEALQATLTSSELTATASAASDGAVSLSVVNSGTRALLVDADRATVKATPTATARSRDQVIKPPAKQQVTSDLADVALGLATMGAAGVVQDQIRHRHSPIAAYYGKDEKRRTLAEGRFGPRIVFPGETSRGKIWFASGTTFPCEVTIPVTIHPEGNDVGILTVRIVAAEKTPQAKTQAKKPE